VIKGRIFASWLVVGAVLLAGNASADQPTARDIIEAAYGAAGGETWRRPQTLELTGVASFYRDGKADQLTVVDDYHMWRMFPGESADAHAANGRVRFDAYSAGKLVFQISYDGRHSYNQHGRIEDDTANAQWSNSFGFGIIRFALDEGFEVKRLADDTVDGHPCYFVRVSDPAGKHTIFGIDRDAYRIRMVGFETPRGWHHRIYDQFRWHENPRFLQPTHVRLYYDGVKTNDILWQTFQVNHSIDPALFTLD